MFHFLPFLPSVLLWGWGWGFPSVHGVFCFRQGYASDTFALALAAVHLFTGEAPYEEIMEEVVQFVCYGVVLSH